MIPLLSILVCTIKSRQVLCGRLRGNLRHQLRPEVEVIYDEDDGELTIGQKRNRLLQNASGEYACFIDDDDTVAEDYVDRLVSQLAAGQAGRGGPDCVGFRAKWYEDGRHVGDCSYTINNARRREVPHGDKFIIERQPGHLTPIRTEIARAVGFEPWNYGEDADFSIRVRPYLSTESFIDDYLYFYWLRSQDKRLHEKVHPQRWSDSNFRIERSLAKAAEYNRQRKLETVPPDTDR